MAKTIMIKDVETAVRIYYSCPELGTKEIMELFARLNKEKGMTILQVTHSEECATYGTRTVVLDSGRTVG